MKLSIYYLISRKVYLFNWCYKTGKYYLFLLLCRFYWSYQVLCQLQLDIKKVRRKVVELEKHLFGLNFYV